MKIASYDNFLNEDLSSVSKFLKSQYNNIFRDSNQNLNNLFVEFTKKVDTDKNVSNLYQRYLRANQTTVQNEINNAESIDAVNKIISDEIKYFYYSLKPIVNKLQNDEFTMDEIFSRSRDKRLQALMSYPEDKFANASSEYVGQILPEIKKDAGLDKPKPTATVEKMRYIKKILEADDTAAIADLVAYKKSAINWINTSLFDLLKHKIQLLNQLGANTSNDIDNLSRQMKGTNNDNAKKMILNKIINLDSQNLKKLSDFLGFTEEEIGKI